MEKLWDLVQREEGLESPEYALIAGLIIPIIIVVVQVFGSKIADAFNRLAASF
jgi:Flp pilus assembly pilin Flp